MSWTTRYVVDVAQGDTDRWYQCVAKLGGDFLVCYPEYASRPVFLSRDGTATGWNFTRWRPVTRIPAIEVSK